MRVSLILLLTSALPLWPQAPSINVGLANVLPAAPVQSGDILRIQATVIRRSPAPDPKVDPNLQIRAGFVVRVTTGSTVNERRSPQVNLTEIASSNVTLDENITVPDQICPIPPATEGGCPATATSLSQLLRVVTIQVYAVAYSSGFVESFRSAPTDVAVVPMRQIGAASPNSLGSNKQSPVSINIAGANIVAGMGNSFTLRKSAAPCRVGASPLQCQLSGNATTTTASGSTITTTIDTLTTAFDPPNTTNPDGLTGSYDAAAFYFEAPPNAPGHAINITSPRGRRAIGVGVFTLDPPSKASGTIDVSRVRGRCLAPTGAATNYTWLPNQTNIIDFRTCMVLDQVNIEATYEFTNYSYANLVPVLRNTGTGRLYFDQALRIEATPLKPLTLTEGIRRVISISWNLPLGINEPLELKLLLLPPPESPIVYNETVFDRAFGTSNPILLSPPPTPLDLSIDHIEVIQTVQNPTNDAVPLIHRKETVVRVFPKVLNSTNFIENVTGSLRAILNGNELRSFSPLPAFNAPMTAVADPKRENQYHSLDFSLPLGWVEEGSLQLIANVSSPTPDPNAANNQLSVTVPIVKAPKWPDPFVVAYVPICYQPDPNERPRCPTDGIRFATDYLYKLYPTGWENVVYFRLPVPPILWTEPIRTEAEMEAVNAFLNALYESFDRSRDLFSRSFGIDQLIGWLPEIKEQGTVGFSDPVWFSPGRGRVAWVQDTSSPNPLDASDSIAHEIAHNLGARHQSTYFITSSGGVISVTDRCGSEDDSGFNVLPPTRWPYTSGTINEIGYEPWQKRFLDGKQFDLMSYCGPLQGNEKWISPHTFNRIFRGFSDRRWAPRGDPDLPTSSSTKIPRRSAVALPSLLVSGTAQKDTDSGTLSPIVTIPSSQPTDASTPEGDHCVRLINQAGDFRETCFLLPFISLQNGQAVPSRTFTVRIDPLDNLQRVVLRRADKELAALSASPNAPTVQFTSPLPNARWTASDNVIQWNATDADGDRLFSTLQYSPNSGNSWLALITNSPVSEFKLDSNLILGGAQVLFRIFVTDGLKTASATVGPIDIPQSPKLEAPVIPLNFRNVQLGATRDLPLVLRNVGSGILTLESITSSSPEFALVNTPLPQLVQSGAPINALLRFRPSAEGLREGTLTLRAANLEPITINVSGRGITSSVPDLEVAPAAIDFPTNPGEARLLLTNHGPGRLRISNLRLSNPAFSLVGASTNFEIGSGADQTITLRVAASSTLTGNLVISSNDPLTPERTLTLRAPAPASITTAPILSATPNTLVFGNVTVAQPKDLTLTLRNTGTANLIISALRSSNPTFLLTTPTLPLTLAPNAQTELPVKFAPTATGPQSGQITITSNVPTATIELTGTGTAATTTAPILAATPNPLAFGNVTVAQSKDLSLTLRNTGTANLIISALRSSNPAFSFTAPTLPFTLAPNTQTELPVRFTPPAAGTQSGQITITSNAPNATVELTGTGAPATVTAPPSLAVSANTLDFGAVTPGQNKTIPLTLRNTGGGPLTILSLSFDHPAFTATPAAPFDIAPGGQQTLTLRFAPTTPATLRAILLISSNDPTVSTLTLPLFGIGASSPNPPVLTAISPESVPAFAKPFSLYLTGQFFTTSSTAQWNGQDRPTTFLNPTLLRADIPAADLANPGTVAIRVANSAVRSLTLLPAGTGSLWLNQSNSEQCPLQQVYLSATDRNGNALVGLNTPNFNCTEDNAPVRCTTEPATAAEIPLSLAIIIDASTSGDLDALKSAARAIVNNSPEGQRILIQQSDPSASLFGSFSAVKSSSLASIDALQTTPATVTPYGVIEGAIRLTQAERSRRQALLILSANENAVNAPAAEQTMLAQARVAGLPVYSISTGPVKPSLDAALRQLALETNGDNVSEPQPSRVALAAGRIQQFLQNQYVLTYSTNLRDGQRHLLQVQMNSAFGSATAVRSLPGCR